MRTNTKVFSKKVQEHILSHFDSYESLKNEIDHYFKNFGYGFGNTMVDYGCFNCYYSQVAETMTKWFEYDNVNDLWAYYKDDSNKLWNTYKSLISRELNHIKNNYKNYIKEVA